MRIVTLVVRELRIPSGVRIKLSRSLEMELADGTERRYKLLAGDDLDRFLGIFPDELALLRVGSKLSVTVADEAELETIAQIARDLEDRLRHRMASSE